MSNSPQFPFPDLRPPRFSFTFPPIFHHFLTKLQAPKMFSSSPFLPTLFLLLSLPLLFFLAPRILSPRQLPIPLSDELDDLNLFHRAIASESHHPARPSSKTRLGGGSPKIAFLFLTNSNLHFAPLWERFFVESKPDKYNIYIHADPTVKIDPPPPGGVFEGRFIAGKKTQRASATLISAARRLLAAAMLDDPVNAYFALISHRHALTVIRDRKLWTNGEREAMVVDGGGRGMKTSRIDWFIF